MLDKNVWEKISSDPDICHGKPCIKGTRIPVYLIVSLVAEGENTESIIQDYPSVTNDDIKSALKYAAELCKYESILKIPQEILDSARLTINDLKTEIAVNLYVQGRLSIGKARELADMSLWEFRQVLALRYISPHYDVSDLDEDNATLHALGRF